MPYDLEKLELAVIGLGYVGLPLAVEFGKSRSVLGFDINDGRISELQLNVDTTGELTKEELYEASYLTFTSCEQELSKCNCYIISVPTPVTEQKVPDLSAVIEATKLVSKYVKKDGLIIYESTVYPGVTEEICSPIISANTGLKLGNDDDSSNANVFHLGYSPERINPGDKDHRLRDVTKITSGSSLKVAKLVDDLYSTIIEAGTHQAQTIMVAEAAKVIENIQRDVNIALANELSEIFFRLGIDSNAVFAAAETKWNFMPFRPGLVGGHCIGVDPYYLTHKAKEAGYQPQIILAGREMNDSMAGVVFGRFVKLLEEKKIDLNSARVLVMGLTFKEDCSDTRNSKVFDLVQYLEGAMGIIDVFDPMVNTHNLTVPDGVNVVKEPAAKTYDGILIAVPHKIFIEMGIEKIKNFGSKNYVIYDVKHSFNANKTDGRL